MTLIANAGVPMFMVQAPAMLAALIPVILIEAYLAKRSLGLAPKTALWGTTVSNVASTLMGVPLAYGLMLTIDLVLEPYQWGSGMVNRILSSTIGMAWLPPDEDSLYWMIPVALTAFLVPTFFVSVWLERFVLRRMWPALQSKTITKAAWELNLVSYGFLLLIGLGLVVYSVSKSGVN